jgi:hypothetical protein
MAFVPFTRVPDLQRLMKQSRVEVTVAGYAEWVDKAALRPGLPLYLEAG